MTSSEFRIIPATIRDLDELTDFISRSQVSNRHLDWQKTINWLGYQPILKCYIKDELISLLVCPVTDHDFIWVRSFCASYPSVAERSWPVLLENVENILRDAGIQRMYSISLTSWYEELLRQGGFSSEDRIITLQRENPMMLPHEISPAMQIREFLTDDINQVINVDHLAFPPLWQICKEDFVQALAVSQNKSVVLNTNGDIIGYQISSNIFDSGHIARIAVHPDYQRKGIASILLENLLSRFLSLGVHEITVNTSSDNSTAINLYLHNGFSYTQNNYPIYYKNISSL
jgi:[ribosomal protein S18]-alanine N-acetyltransferase